jgi:hypothetical protein
MHPPAFRAALPSSGAGQHACVNAPACFSGGVAIINARQASMPAKCGSQVVRPSSACFCCVSTPHHQPLPLSSLCALQRGRLARREGTALLHAHDSALLALARPPPPCIPYLGPPAPAILACSARLRARSAPLQTFEPCLPAAPASRRAFRLHRPPVGALAAASPASRRALAFGCIAAKYCQQLLTTHCCCCCWAATTT